jgi:dolichol-phosphate mannosyltransferase
MRENSAGKSLDIITSALNEEECLVEFISRVQAVMSEHPAYNWRLIICDNGSVDRTWQIIRAKADEFENILGVRMSRTFPLDAAFTMGLDRASADAAIIMASDLQDPPEVIHGFIEKYEEGYEQVVAKVIKREHVPFIRRTLSALFYTMANKATKNMIPRGVSDFRLLNRSAYLASRQLREKNRFLRGLLAWSGFRTFELPIERPARFAGESEFVKIKLRVVIRWAIGAILSHTAAPLHLVSVLSFLLSIISILVTGVLSLVWITSGVPFDGYGSIMGLMTLGFSVILAATGVISQYLALIYEEVKQRPIYVIAETTD